MKTKELLTLLREQSQKALLFEYRPNQFVGANYHITEIKNITVDAVDCGAGTDFWKETVIQLYESPEEKNKKEFMTAYKALSILNKVDRIKPMEKEVEVKFEYSNDTFHTAQLFVNNALISNERVILQLGIAKTDCKAKDACGIPVPQGEEKATESCTPESGCC